jgi:selenocysteine lyase/cysteine desulfurase
VYKFYGPHVGVLYGRYELLDRLRAYKVRPAHDEPPGKFETGTQNHEGIAGALAAVDYLAGLGAFAGSRATDAAGLQPSRRQRLRAALSMIRDYDRQLTVALLGELEGIPQLTIHGITDPQHLDWRVPTVSFTIDGQHPAAIAAALGQAGIFVWHGNYYAVAVTERLGLEDKGGMVRVGAVHYNTPGEIRRFGETLRRWLAAQA